MKHAAAASEGNSPSDLEIRLARYRSRVAAEGRKAALKSIDRAIDEEREVQAKRPG